MPVTVPFGVPARLWPGDPTGNGDGLRLGARVLLLDANDRLLLRAYDPVEPDRRWWELPGSGLPSSETTAQACQRELAEETGIELPLRVGRESRLRFRGRHYHRREWVHLARLP